MTNSQAIEKNMHRQFIKKHALHWVGISVAEPPLYWAATAPAPGGQGPGADSGSNLPGSAPAPG